MKELLTRAASKSVLLCGEAIIDIYHYVKPLGRPTKDAILSVEVERTERFHGGVTAAYLHVVNICQNSQHYHAGTIWRKERYVDSAHFHKLFQTYSVEHYVQHLYPTFENYDTVIVLDYGHGLATPEFLRRLQTAKYLAVNVQTNSGNYGYNLATKYAKADFLCVDESEARLATQNRDGHIRDSLFALGRIAPKVVVTLGKKGAIGLDEGRHYEQAAFTDKVVDTMGAGDAFFALAALVAQEADMPTILRLGCAAAAVKANIVGHQRPVTRDAIAHFLPELSESTDDRAAPFQERQSV